MYTSIRTRLRFFRSIFCSRRPLPQHSLSFLPNLPSLFPMSTQSPPLTRKSTTGPSQGVHPFPLYHIEWIDGAHGSVSPESLARISPSRLPSCWDTIGLVRTHTCLFFSDLFLVVLFLVKCTQDAGLDSSDSQSHVPSFFLFTPRSILLVD